MQFNMIDKILSAIKDYHIPTFIGMFFMGSIMAWFHHLDMSFVAFTGTLVGGITGHAFSGAGKPDDKPEQPKQ